MMRTGGTRAPLSHGLERARARAAARGGEGKRSGGGGCHGSELQEHLRLSAAPTKGPLHTP